MTGEFVLATLRANNTRHLALQEGRKALDQLGIALAYLSWPSGDPELEFLAWHSFVHVWFLANAHGSACYWAGRAADLEVAAVYPQVCA